MKNHQKTIDILCIGEILIDFISHQMGQSIAATKDYHRYLGGSPTNVAMNMSRLGLRAAIVASVGNDGFGEYILNRLKECAINTDGIKQLDTTPTTVIFVSRTEDTPEFIPYREADAHISGDQLPETLLKSARLFHTSCFALSKNPAQATILSKAKQAVQLGCTLSIDLNYSEKIWPDTQKAVTVIEEFCRLDPLIKISEDDMFRLFGQHLPHEEIFHYFHRLGVTTICLTLGKKGAVLSQKGEETLQLPAPKIKNIKDATGAGDAFWSGFLFAWLQEKTPRKCMETALQLAALKLQNVGRIPDYTTTLSGILNI